MAIVEAIATCYLEADAASVGFSSIPQTYEHLQVSMSVADPDESSTTGYHYIHINGDTGSGGGFYTNYRMTANAGTESANANAGQNYMWSPFLAAKKRNGSFSVFGTWVIDIFDYVNPNKSTTISWFQSQGIKNSYSSVGLGCGVWDDTSNDPVDEITLSTDVGGGPAVWARGSSFTLYGWNSA